MNWKRSLVTCVALVASLYMAGCGGSSSTPPSVSVQASATTVDATDTVTLSATVTGDKNAAGVSWSVTGGGTLSGQTTSAATYTAPAASSSALSVTVTATSVADTSKSATATITVPAAPAITTAALATATVGATYAQPLTATGGIAPYAWTLVSGTLPSCLTITQSASGASLGGTLTASCAGTFNDLVFKVTDSGTPNALTATTAAMGLTIDAAPAITFSGVVPATATAHVAYAGGSAAASGGVGTLTYSVFSGTLPNGLSLNASSGAITGTPTTANTFNFVIKAADTFGDSNTHSYQIVVSAPPAITFSGVVPATATAHVAYAGGSAAASGGVGTLTYSVFSGALPDGLSLNASTAAITGTPTTANTFNFVIKAADTFGDSNTQAYTIVVSAPPAITFSGVVPATATAHVAYAGGSAAASGGAGALAYTVFSGALPDGLSLNASTAAITGTPTTANTFNFVIKAADTFGDSNTHSYQIVVSAPPAITFSGVVPAAATAHVAYAGGSAAASGGVGTLTYSVFSGALPDGLSLNASTAAITGTPTTANTFNFVIKAADTFGDSNTQAYTIVVSAPPAITFSGVVPAAATAHVAYAGGSAAASGGAGALAYTLFSGALPNGLSLNASSGAITGTPTTANTFNFVIKAADTFGDSNTQAYTIVVSAPPAIVFSGVVPANATYNVAYPGGSAAATGGAGALTYTVFSGALPNGLGLNATTAAITGTPTTANTFNFFIKAADAFGDSNTQAYSIIVSYPPVVLMRASLPTGYVGSTYTQTSLTGTGGTGVAANYIFALTNGTLPAGLNLSTAGVISGQPTGTPGDTNFSVTVTDSVADLASAATQFSITVDAGLSITTPTTLPSGYGGTTYSQTLAATGGSGGYAWTVTAGASSLRAVGLSLSGSGVLSGTTPSAGGTANFTAKVTDSASNTTSLAFSVTINAGLTITTPTTLPSGYGGSPYSQQLAASGGAGGPFVWAVTAGGSDLTNLGLALSSGGLLTSGGPNQGNVSFTVQVTDSGSNTTSATFSLAILQALTINSASSFTGYVGAPFSQTLTSAGGTGTGLVWGVATNGAGLQAIGLSLGTNDGIITGTPTASGVVTIDARVVDSALNTAHQSITITINIASQVTGNISLNNNCGSISPLPTYSVTISDGGGFTQTVSTDSGGNYTFTGIPDGTYTITPSITGPNSLFYPATYSNVVLSASTVTGENFGVSLGYTVSGTVGYRGAQTGQVYLNLVNNNCGGSGEGTSITAPGSFTIQGVPPGSYTLQSWMDPTALSQGAQNVTDPTGSVAVSVSNANVSGTSVTLADPTLSAPTETPNLEAIEPTDSGVAITFGGGSISNGNGVEVFTSYQVQADLTSGFTTPITATFRAIGRNPNLWIMNNQLSSLTGGTFSNQPYYFRVMGLSAAGNSGWANWGGPGVNCALPTCAVAVPVGAPPSTSGNQVAGTVVIPSTITPTGPLYMGLFDMANNIAYATYITNPTNDPAGNSFTVYAPNGNNYFAFGILDQNKDGLVDVGDVTNTNSNSSSMVSVAGTTSVPSFTLPSANSTALVQTQFNQELVWNGTSSQTNTGYNLNFQVREGNQLPVSVELTSASNPNVITPVDLSNYCQGCGSVQFLLGTSIGSTAPAVNDSYTFTVNYSEGPPDTVVGKVSGVLDTSALATNLEPEQTDSTNTTPTFTWTYPAAPGNYVYQFYVCCGGSGNIWQIPGNNSNSNGFTNTQIPGSLTWGSDPTNGSNKPTSPLNSTGTTYNWSIQSQDSNGNSAQNSVWYEPLP